MNIYVLLTKMKVHTYTSWARALQVRLRAERRGIKLEFTQTRTSTRKATISSKQAARLFMDSMQWPRCSICDIQHDKVVEVPSAPWSVTTLEIPKQPPLSPRMQKIVGKSVGELQAKLEEG